MISDIVITEKNEKPGTHRAFSDKVARDIDGFTDNSIDNSIQPLLLVPE